MTRLTFAWLVLGAALWPGTAWANWEYTKWGMTPEQVQAAAKGKLSPATPQDACQSCGSAPLLAGDFTAAGQIFGLRFVFADGKALSAVVLATQSTPPPTSSPAALNRSGTAMLQHHRRPLGLRSG